MPHNMILEEQVYEISLKNKTSGYVSASKVEAGLLEFAEGYDYGYIYKIIKPSNVMDVNAIYGSKSPFPWEQEMAVPLKVPNRKIVSSYKVGN
jgi:hypothetical protein